MSILKKKYQLNQTPPKTVYYRLKAKCLEKDLYLMPQESFEDWYKEVLESPVCYYCGHELTLRKEKAIHKFTIDRLVPEWGYAEDNIVPCCWRCNIIKGNWFTPQEMLDLAENYLVDRED